MTAEKPAPCPVCGGKPWFFGTVPKFNDVGDQWAIHCVKAAPDSDHDVRAFGDSKPAAIAAWNRAYGGRNAKAE